MAGILGELVLEMGYDARHTLGPLVGIAFLGA